MAQIRKIQSIIVIKVVRSPVIQAYPEKIEFYARIDEERLRGELTRMLPGEASRALCLQQTHTLFGVRLQTNQERS